MRSIFFDVGNTLVWLDHPFIVELLAEHGIIAEESALLPAEYVARRRMDEILRSADPGTDESRISAYFGEMLRELGVPERAMSSVGGRLRERHAERGLWSRVLPGTPEILGDLRRSGFALGVISNADGRVRALLESTGLLHHFGCVIDSAEAGVEKPDAEIFGIACRALGADPGWSTYVGDLYEVDVVGARAVGMRAILLDPLDRWGDLDCERIASLEALPALLERAS